MKIFFSVVWNRFLPYFVGLLLTYTYTQHQGKAGDSFSGGDELAEFNRCGEVASLTSRDFGSTDFRNICTEKIDLLLHMEVQSAKPATSQNTEPFPATEQPTFQLPHQPTNQPSTHLPYGGASMAQHLKQPRLVQPFLLRDMIKTSALLQQFQVAMLPMTLILELICALSRALLLQRKHFKSIKLNSCSLLTCFEGVSSYRATSSVSRTAMRLIV